MNRRRDRVLIGDFTRDGADRMQDFRFSYCIVHHILRLPEQRLEKPEHVRGALEHPHIGAAECSLAGQEFQIEMGPPPASPMESRGRSTYPGAKLLQLRNIVAGGKHVGPASSQEVLPIHHDHG
jgi:hypothetical protein